MFSCVPWTFVCPSIPPSSKQCTHSFPARCFRFISTTIETLLNSISLRSLPLSALLSPSADIALVPVLWPSLRRWKPYYVFLKYGSMWLDNQCVKPFPESWHRYTHGANPISMAVRLRDWLWVRDVSWVGLITAGGGNISPAKGWVKARKLATMQTASSWDLLFKTCI